MPDGLETPRGGRQFGKRPSALGGSFGGMAVPSQATPLFDISDEACRPRLQRDGRFRGVPSYLLDVFETIPELGYGSHQFFRYYGKFPSVVGREIVQRHGRPGKPILDIYAGCGTSLVEGQSAGHPSFGVDLNPLAVLACNVKTAYMSAAALCTTRDRIIGRLATSSRVEMPETLTPAKLEKWFTPETREELSALRCALLDEPPSLEREFLLLAFLGIVRRVSTAYDGEIRPHVNPDKKPRSAVRAFVKKSNEMIDALSEVDSLRPPGVLSRAAIGDNRASSTYSDLLGTIEPNLVIAHPPYLNSFNYFQVFSLEFAWAEGFDDLWCGRSLRELRQDEHIAWPATTTKVLECYYEDFERAIVAALRHAAHDATIAVVIGDATIRGRLEQVHSAFWERLKRLGLMPLEIWFRTTHYGIGKYAYRHRADYHGDAEKRDAILFFRTD